MIGRNQLNNFVGRNFTWQSDITRFLIGLLIVRMVCHFCEQLLVEMMTLQTIMGKFSYNLNWFKDIFADFLFVLGGAIFAVAIKILTLN